MIIPMVCVTCGKPISHLYDTYLDLVKNYEMKMVTKDQEPGKPTPEFFALRDLKIWRECCRRMFLSQQDMYEKIK